MNRTTIVGVVLALLPPVAAEAADLAIRNGDVMVFLGDAITEEYQGRGAADRVSYPTHVESFLTVRYPDVRVTYYNVAWSKVSAAADTLGRLERDVLPLKPTVAVMCFGMQDGALGPVNEAVLNAHKAAMTGLVKRLKDAGCRVYVLSPPSIDAATTTTAADRNDSPAAYAEAQKAIAAAHGAEFVDWFTASREARAKAVVRNPNFYFTRDGIHHTTRSLALAATLLLKAFRAEPIDVRITLDWKENVLECNVDGARLTIGEDGRRTVYVPNVPLPWPTFMGRMEGLGSDWEAAEWCRYLLTIRNSPPALMLAQEAGARQVPMMAVQLTEGYNLALLEPLRSLEAAVDLANLIRRKNYTRVHCWRDQELEPVKEKELIDAQKTLIEAWNKYFVGYNERIANSPKSFDLVFDVSAIPTMPPPTAPAATRPLPMVTPPASTAPAQEP